MKIEYLKDLNTICVYSSDQLPSPPFLKPPFKQEKHRNTYIYSGAPNQKINCTIRTVNITNFLQEIKCKHNQKFHIKVSKLLPREGWHDLVDCWMCCGSQKNTVLENKISVVPGVILLSDFYFIVHKDTIPDCCPKSKIEMVKMFYNEINYPIDEEYLVYKYLDEYFYQSNYYVFGVNGIKYEIKMFYKTFIEKKDGFVEALKIGLKKTEKLLITTEHINGYFTEKILEIVKNGYTGAILMGYDISII